jgi:hypothetical protein
VDPENVRIGFRSRPWSAPKAQNSNSSFNLEILERLMNTGYLGNPLIGELLADPAVFKERGRAYQLLEEYFAGLPVQTLRPLLQHTDTLVKYAAVWVASELGQQASTVLDDIVPLVDSDDRFLSYHALEIIVACAIGNLADRFIGIPRALESRDDVIRVLAMRLLTRAHPTQLEAAAGLADRITGCKDVHRCGLLLLARCESGDHEGVRRMLSDDNPVAQMYGAIAANRLGENSPELLQAAAELADPSISRFAREAAQFG